MDSETIAKIAQLKRVMKTSLSQVKYISDLGKSALHDSKNIIAFKGAFKSMDRYFTQYESAYDELTVIHELQNAVAEFPNDADVSNMNAVRKCYFQACSNHESIHVTPGPSTSAQTPSILNSTITNESRIELPRIDVPKFDGQLLNWPKFRDTFTSMIHKEDALSPIKKFHYLKLALSGSASTVINHLPLTENNYAVAWEALEKHYDCKRMLASAYLNQILDYKPIIGTQTVESLKSFLTKVGDNIAAFKLLKINDEASFILFHLASRGLDLKTREQFELANKNVDFPSYENLTKFIREKCLAMELADGNINFNKKSENSSRGKDKKNPFVKNNTHSKLSLLANTSDVKLKSFLSCFVCKQTCRSLSQCATFLNADAKQRFSWLRHWKGCKNCLSSQHATKSCDSQGSCKWCQRKHHSLLCLSHHTVNNDHNQQSSSSTGSDTTGLPPVGNTMHSVSYQPSQIIMGTVVADLRDGRGKFQQIRIVIDSASHYSFITQRCVQRLGLNINKCVHRVSGIGQTAFTGSKGEVSCILKPRTSASPNLTTNALVVKEITSFLPTTSLSYDMWRHYLPFSLADPKFFESGPIDFLLGCDLFADIWTGAPIVVRSDIPKLFPTIFGHIVMGKFINSESQHNTGTSLLVVSSNDEVFMDLQQFWELEEPTPSKEKLLSSDESACEIHFQQTHYRRDDGSYVVQLPFKNEIPNFGNYNYYSLKRFHNLEDKLRKNPSFRAMYVDFMHEYEQLHHMSPILSEPKYILPHHGVFKTDGLQNKIRVVFDGSAKTPNGSLNDHLFIGPKLQTDIRNILLNFRAHRIAFVTDIVKMYRNIWVHPHDCAFQCIYWRYDSNDALQMFQLETVTYGLSCSPYLALRVIQQLNFDEGSNFPLASRCLERDIYIDDLVTGADTVLGALELQDQLVSLLKKGNFTLSKWASNCSRILEMVPEKDQNCQPISISPEDDVSLKILGLQWNPSQDCFQFKLHNRTPMFTKRGILSFVAKIYDPLGFLSPYTVRLKGFIQELWKLGVSWDEPITPQLTAFWKSSIEDIDILSSIQIPRFIGWEKPYNFQIVGFSDASMKSYCATLYLRIITTSTIQVKLLTAKTKLAPLKTISVPRLELCGAYLLAKLYKSIFGFLDIISSQTRVEPRFFTDSTVVLGWIRTPSYQLKTFVANRVAEISNVIPASSWSHVPSEQNPSDCGSRGLNPIELANHPLWWTGPSWLNTPENEWPISNIDLGDSQLPELKVHTTLLVTPTESLFVIDLIKRFSSYNKLLRVLARILRLSHNVRHSTNKISGPIKISEYEHALHICVKHTQAAYFFNGKSPEATMARFVKLNPFLDNLGVLRAGGRLYHATLPFNHKHPVLLPNNCHLSILILDHFHKYYLHPGPSLLQALVQTRFWIPSLRRLAQQRTFQCMKCYKLKAQHITPQMANLPAFRLKGERAFVFVGTDFAGPFVLRESLRRKAPTSKVYMCLFICLTTKAIHLEPVTSMSTDAFMAAFDRFCSRRGLPSEIVSDCGSNYISASSRLKSLWKWFQDTHRQQEISDFYVNKGIRWRFNPPAAPHFGGIWEAGVKSAKRLIQRTAGDTPLTYEELCTLFSKCEAVLNSRPLCPLSSDPSENGYLSPGHFLIGTHLLAHPEPTLLDVKLNQLDRWQLVTRMTQHFWQRWRIEYLSTLQSRMKWTKSSPNLKVGQLVLLKDPNTPVLHWPLARIAETHPGHDGVVRVVTVQSKSATYKRPVVKLVPLLPLSKPSYPNDDPQI